MARDVRNISYDFTGEVVLITGAGKGLGRSHALGFAAAGADLVICDIGVQMSSTNYALGTPSDLDAITEDCRKLGARVLPVICDVRSSEQVEIMVRRGIEEFTKIDVLVNNAGIESVLSVSDMSEDAWDELIDTNLKGVFLCSKYVSLHMIEARKGTIVMTGSTSSFGGLPRNAHYCAAKHGLLGFSKALAIELAPYGINVNVICPSGVDTTMAAGMFGGEFKEWEEQVRDVTGSWNLFEDGPLEPNEITMGVMYLASDAAKYMTGSELKVDAGFTIK